MYTPPTAAQQLNQIPPQASPTGSSNSRPSPPTASIPRHHATPPQASVSPNELAVPPSLSQVPQSSSGYNTHYGHAIGLAHGPSLTRYQNMDDSYHITPELLAEIERADQQQAQTHSGSPAFNYPRNGSTTPPRDHNIERVRAAERSSPMELDSRRQRDRESPIARQPHSPSAFTQAQNTNPERRASDSPARASPLGGGSSGETYTAYSTRDSPSHRRAVNALNNDSRSQYSLATQTPPLQPVSARQPERISSVRSLPVQEEAEDDPQLAIKEDPWNGLEHFESRHLTSSPTPSSELHPEGNLQRREMHHPTTSTNQYSDDGSDTEEGAKTPRSPSVGLPDRIHSNMTGIRIPMRATGRAGTMDQLGLRGIDETIHQPTPKAGLPGPSQSSHSQRFGPPSHQRRLSVDPNFQYHQSQYYADDSSPFSLYHGQFLPEEYYAYAEGGPPFYPDGQYGDRPRPDAPIPPTPHSQTAASSPSPFLHLRNGRNSAVPSPVPVAGSPYPYPFNHVRRSFVPSHNARDHHDPNADPNLLRDQIANQWQIFAQNTHALGNITDSTLSPSSTPFQGNFAPWAHLHARRTLGRALDLRSMQSSPGLDRGEAPPIPPPSVFRSKKKQQGTSNLRKEVPAQVIPPRVQSTQPRDTSPEPSTSGEETAGEDDYAVPNPNRSSWGNGAVPDRGIVEDDGDGDWVDEDEEPDEDDFLELEYHPSYVKSVNKRRRRWEIRWEALLEAFRALDRQTDATMVLLAAPSHSTKLYSMGSRSVRRQNLDRNSPDMTALKNNFKRIAAHRRKTRSHVKASVVDRFLASSAASGDGSDTSESREQDLKRALETTLGSLRAFEHIFTERESRTAEEMRRIKEDRERVEILLKQVLGDSQRNGLNTSQTASLL
ncbi:hypothetical protein AN958_02828 [Leucoagaricus sp. SymC.cos]|nr:hypothetical protein AN958_02828 [Leucoagaricus sp. SymC.cos]